MRSAAFNPFSSFTSANVSLKQEEVHAPFQEAIEDTETIDFKNAPQTRARLIELAQEEWKRWGELQAIVERNNGRICLQDKEGACIPEEKTYRSFKAPMRYSEGQCQTIARYWRAVGREFNCDEINAPQWPWSAAFISWLFHKSGFSKEQFLPSEGHARYIVDARDQRLPKGMLKAEQVPALPEIGDLICSVRARDSKIQHMSEIEAGKTLSHCDLVVGINPDRKEIEVIGGNVFGVVAKTTVELDDTMQLNPTTNERRPWLVVLRNRQFV